MNKYDTFIADLQNSNALQITIKEIYLLEFNEQFENILLKKEAEFMRYLTLRANFQIEERYSNEAFENMKLVTCIKECEKEIYEKEYRVALEILKTHLNDNDSKQNSDSQPIFFRKHCKYQTNKLIHSCEEEDTMLAIYNKDNNKQIDYLICKLCLCAYKSSFVKIYCDFCYMSYYSLIEKEKSKKNFEIQLATWEKYHCDLMINEQMRCIQCNSDLFLHIINNQLMCPSCNFISDPLEIVWKCIECTKEFTSNAKIFNPNEHKTMTLAIKDSMFNKRYAFPSTIPCGHLCEFFRHTKECVGILYLTELSNTKMVICSKCNEMIKYDKYIWTCQVCSARFRNNSQRVSIDQNNEIIKKFQNLLNANSANQSKVKRGESNHSSLDIISKEFANSKENPKKNAPETSDRKKDNIEDFDIRRLYSKSKDEEVLSPKQSVQLPLFDLSTYDIVSQISTSQTSKLFAVKSNIEKSSYKAMKRHSYSDEAEMISIMQKYALHYSLQSEENILDILGLNIDYPKQEINVLEELGIDDWESEIASMTKLKENYTEKEILSILYQLTHALAFLQENDYVHWYINPKNVIIFKNRVYKWTDLGYLKEASSYDIIQNDNALISPNLNKIFQEKKGKKVNLIKSDVYSLGLCIIKALTHDNQYKIFSDFVNVDIGNEDSDKIMKRFEKMIKERIGMKLISNNFISLILKMINVDEEERVDFIKLKEILKKY